MSTSRLNGALSPPLPVSRSGASSPSPKQKFPGDALRPHIKALLNKTLANAVWDPSDRPRMAAYSKEISERVKQRMVEIEPRGFKYIVTATLSENLGQAGRADMSCHWEDTDIAIQEMFSNPPRITASTSSQLRR
nr:uncharacterized protein CI109_003414 [Kwoniella shandongensis]KAA5528126.1 hypothetical protein CI109_003414 [Kwoniella shandongensis]